MEKRAYPTPRGAAANKAKQKYNKEHYSHISFNVSKEYHLYLKLLAKEAGQSLNAWILKAVEDRAENRQAETQEHDWGKLIEWLSAKGCSDAEILDCIYFISSGEHFKQSKT